MNNLLIVLHNSKYSLRRSPLWRCINLLWVGILIHDLTKFVRFLWGEELTKGYS